MIEILSNGAGPGLTVNKISAFDTTIDGFKSEKVVIENADEIDQIGCWTSRIEYNIMDDVKVLEIEVEIPEDYKLVTHIFDEELYKEDKVITETVLNLYSYLRCGGPLDAYNSLISHLK